MTRPPGSDRLRGGMRRLFESLGLVAAVAFVRGAWGPAAEGLAALIVASFLAALWETE